ncbi:hypothetical protein D3C74_355660 [compost metagenome]
MILKAEEIADDSREHRNVASEAESNRSNTGEEQAVAQGSIAEGKHCCGSNSQSNADQLQPAHPVGQGSKNQAPYRIKDRNHRHGIGRCRHIQSSQLDADILNDANQVEAAHAGGEEDHEQQISFLRAQHFFDCIIFDWSHRTACSNLLAGHTLCRSSNRSFPDQHGADHDHYHYDNATVQEGIRYPSRLNQAAVDIFEDQAAGSVSADGYAGDESLILREPLNQIGQ